MENKRLTRRDFLRASALTAAGLVVAACGPTPTAPATEKPAAEATTTPKPAEATATPAPAEPTATPAPAAAGGQKMVFWPEWGGKDADALQAQVNKYTQETGIAVEFLPIRDHARMIASMGAGNPPDLLMTWDANAVGTWGFEGAIKDLKPYIELTKFDLSKLHPMGVASGNLMGVKQIGLPLSNYICTVLYWNKDAFTTAKLDPETPPQTWEELWDMAEKITVVENGQIKTWGYAVLTAQDSHPTTMAYAFGGSIWSDDYRQVTPDSEATIEALKWMRKFYEKYTTDEVRRWSSSVNLGDDAPTNPLYTGQAGMQLNGEWVPSFVDRLTDIKVNVGATYMPYPTAKPEVKGTMAANSNPMVIPTAAKNPDAAFKFIEFISRPETSAEMCVIVGNASPVKEGVKLQAAKTENAMYRWVLEEAWIKGNIKPMTINSPIGAQYMDAFTRARAEVVEDGKDPAETMKGVKDEIQPQLDEALKKLGI